MGALVTIERAISGFRRDLNEIPDGNLLRDNSLGRDMAALPHWLAVALFLWLLMSAEAQDLQRISVTVTDENGVGIADALVELTVLNGSFSLQCRTGPIGTCSMDAVRTSLYQIRVQKANFYAYEASNLRFDNKTSLEVVLARQREVREVVNVQEWSPAIDPEQVSTQEQISGVDLINLPYPTTRDYRAALEYIPQVVTDAYLQPHITGAETYQTLVLFDGFNVTQPGNGQLLFRVSTDSFRSINVQTSRISAEYGKSSGGVIELNTANGDDHLRFIATDFFPSLQDKRGITLDKVTPRFTLSGPIRKGHAWFYEAIDGEYDNIIITELPPGADSDIFWRLGNLLKLQDNFTPRNIFTSSFNVNFAHDQHSGLSLQDPQISTPILDEPMYEGNLKDQYYFKNGQLLEVGLSFNRYDLDETPRGNSPYFVNPNQAGGSYYFTAHTTADRWQLYSNVFLRPISWHGNHQFKVGVDLDRLRYDFDFYRQPISYLYAVQSLPPGGCAPPSQTIPCSRYSQFSGPSATEQYNVELSGYAQDRWLVTNRFLVEGGLRFDWDQIVRRELTSPRLAATYVLSHAANTKFSAGVGLFYDATPMFLIARPQAGTRTDFFYDSTGALTSGPVTSVFQLPPSQLNAPRYLNWSVGLEQKMPARIYLKAEFIEKRSSNSFDYNWLNPVNLGTGSACTPLSPCTAQFQLENGRHDQFDSFEINLRRTFENGHLIMGSYVRTKSHSDQVLDLNVDNPVFSTQQAGPYAWDAPNRFLSWGFLPLGSLPLIKRLDFGYSMEYRTGFPFFLVNNQQQFAALSGAQTAAPYFLRFPQFFTLNTHVEKRFRAFGCFWALRGGFDNITGRRNYWFVNNDVDSPEFLGYSGFSGRAFTGRIRFLGRK
jgi:hypothetical protein